MNVYIFAAIAANFVLATWVLCLLSKFWARIFYASSTTAFIGSLLYIMYDYALWDGAQHIRIIGLIDQAVRYLQHGN